MQAIERLRELKPELQGLKVACAGRLDPMAEGVLVVLAGDALKQFNEFCNLDKEYEAEVLFGVQSDSGDVMGLIESCKVHQVHKVVKSIEIERIENVLSELRGELKLQVPVYSSWRVKGRPMYWWARQGRLGEIEIPMHEFIVYKAEFLGMRKIAVEELRKSVTARLEIVHGDFRQDEIKRQWELIFREQNQPFDATQFRINCSSGTYVRSIVHEIGRRLGMSVMLYRLIRTRVGEYTSEISARLSQDRSGRVGNMISLNTQSEY